MNHRRIVNQVAVGAALAVLATAAQADTIYVDDDNCPGPGSGTEGDPYCSIQTAIDNAVDTDEIVVAPGTYFENINFLGRAITLRSADGPDVTIIEPGSSNPVVSCVSGEGPSAILDGFTITGGSAPYAGGMFNWYSSPTVTNCTFSGNVVPESGGGMLNWHSSNPTVTNCTFSGNTADVGGGMCNRDSSSPTVTDCTFVGNSAGWGGGMFSWDGSNPTVTDCTFDGNTAELGAGMYIDNGSLKLINCTFTNHGSAGSLYVGECTINACPSDSDGNGAVDVIDVMALLAAWGPCP
jgi:parallel beta-helix repeat protein